MSERAGLILARKIVASLTYAALAGMESPVDLTDVPRRDRRFIEIQEHERRVGHVDGLMAATRAIEQAIEASPGRTGRPRKQHTEEQT
jgi:hypothetical protein